MSTTPPPNRAARAVLTTIVIVCTLAISGGAGWVSFLAFRHLAMFFGWPADTAWVVMPLVELFLVVGSAEAALRVLEGEKATGPLVLAYSALVATLAVNITDHVLPLIDNGVLVAWRLTIVGAFGALVPIAQMGALHMLTGRLRRMAAARAAAAEATPVDRGPSLTGLFKRAIAQTVEARLATTVARVDTPASVEQTRATTTRATEPARAAATTQTRAATTSAPRAPRADSARGTSAREVAGARGEAAYAQYAAQVDRDGTEPDGKACAQLLGASDAGYGRNARLAWRKRYAREIVAGARDYPNALPGDVAALLPPNARTGARGVDGARDDTDNVVRAFPTTEARAS